MANAVDAEDRLSQAQIDARLLASAKRGDVAASRQLVEMHLDRLVGFAYRLLGDHGEAEDVAQEAFLRLWRRAPRWQAKAPVAHWLNKVAYNLSMERLRRRAPLNLEDMPELVDPGLDPAQSLHGDQIGRQVEAAIAALPERQKVAVLLAHGQGYGNIEVAGIMEISVEAVESLLGRGRRSLRATLGHLRSDLEGDL
ncbi:MAG: sigma-70 family RNA polymerase sigma factor [Rhodospirillales bacterium]|nr:sigma-70 family RNA polymerase sigma factor [Rhodospirillales bacterium]